jgi:DNA invertase Pin-like site-specific DNA recombinase
MTHFAVNPRDKKAGEKDITALGRAAQYLRMSTEYQEYSIANQSAAIALYAAAHDLGIVRSFVDAGKTGTTIRHRRGLQELIRTVESGAADFDHILVYDVSRWGRFLDSDESAYYEYLCKLAGISVRYCAEQFENDNSPTSNLLKALKRTMAGEYSRELGVKVSVGQRRLASMGFWQGGGAPFGMMRQLVDQNRNPKCILKVGQWKSISRDRVLLTPGPPEAVATIRLAFDLYTKERKSRHQIVEILNIEKRFRGRTPWTLQRLNDLLMDPIYKGAYPYGKTECTSHSSRRLNRDKWLVGEHAFPAIISEKQWNVARDRIQQEINPLVDSDMLDGLRRLWKRKGHLNSDLINAARDIPSAVAYQHHFGGVNEAYKLIGYPLPKDYSFVNAINLSRRIRCTICDEICKGVVSLGGTAEKLPARNMLLLNREVTVHVSVCKGWVRPKLTPLWRLLLGKVAPADILIVGRLLPPSSSVLDYFVFPAVSQLRGVWSARTKDNDLILDLYRSDDLRDFIESFARFSFRGFA